MVTPDERRLKALGDYLKSRRARLTPAAVGLPPGYNRRRTPGLRREEVAQLAGVSTTWYTWLEQGRDIHVSRPVLECVGRALRLSDEEYNHMMNLAQFPVQAPDYDRSLPVSPALQLIMDGLDYPAIAVNNRSDVLAWNAAASRYFTDFAAVSGQERNMLWQWFANQSLRERIVNWEERSPYAVALFRGFCDRYADDPWYPAFAGRLMQISPYFKEQWERREIRQKSGGFLDFAMPGRERQSLEATSFPNVNGFGDLHLFVFTPVVRSSPDVPPVT